MLHLLFFFRHLSPRLYFPFPTESRPKQRLTKVRRCCFIPGKPSLLERRRGMEQQRKRAQRAALHLLMMARGGRENGAQRRNPNRITKDEAPDKSQALLFYARLLS
jgi:hypothetical protein